MDSVTRSKLIVARASSDWLEAEDDAILAVILKSDHPRYRAGEKLDWHRLAFALHDGYALEIQPATQHVGGPERGERLTQLD